MKKKPEPVLPDLTSPTAVRPPDEHERRGIERGLKLLRGSRARAQVSFNQDAPQKIGSPHNDPDYLFALTAALGTTSGDFLDSALSDLASMTVRSGGVVSNKELNAGLAFVDGGEPENEIEASLLVQMFATHSATMRCMRTIAGDGGVTRQRSRLRTPNLNNRISSSPRTASALSRSGTTVS